jgi:hypothetical protein
VSKPRGGNRPSRSVDLGSRTLKEYQEAERRRAAWAEEHALREQLEHLVRDDRKEISDG